MGERSCDACGAPESERELEECGWSTQCVGECDKHHDHPQQRVVATLTAGMLDELEDDAGSYIMPGVLLALVDAARASLAARARIAELEATLARVRELPAKWLLCRQHGTRHPDVRLCADELASALAGE